MASEEGIPRVDATLIEKLSKLTRTSVAETAQFVSEVANKWLTNRLSADLAQKTGEPQDEIEGALTTIGRDGKPSLWGPQQLQKMVNDILQGGGKPPMAITEELYDSARSAGVAALLSKHSLSPSDLTEPDQDSDYWKDRDKDIDWKKHREFEKDRKRDYAQYEKEAEEAWRDIRARRESPLTNDLKDIGRELLIKVMHLIKVIELPEDPNEYDSEEAYLRAKDEIQHVTRSFGPRSGWKKVISDLAAQYTELTGEIMPIDTDKEWIRKLLHAEVPDTRSATEPEDTEEEEETTSRPRWEREEGPGATDADGEEDEEDDWGGADEFGHFDERRIIKAVDSLSPRYLREGVGSPNGEEKIRRFIQAWETPRIQRGGETFEELDRRFRETKDMVAQSLSARWQKIREISPELSVEEFIELYAPTSSEILSILDQAQSIGGGRSAAHKVLIPLWTERKLKNPGASLEQFLSKYESSESDQDYLKNYPFKLRGQYPILDAQVADRFNLAKIRNPRINAQEFAESIDSTEEEEKDILGSNLKLAGQYPVPDDFLLWRWRVYKIGERNPTIDEFKRLIQSPLNSQNQVARILGKRAQSIASQMVSYRRRYPGVPDQQLWIKIIEDSAPGLVGDSGLVRIGVPTSVVDGLTSLLATSASYVDAVADLTRKLMDLQANKAYIARLSLKDPEAAESLQGISPHAAAVQAAIMVGQHMARKLTTDIAAETEQAVTELSKYVDNWDGKPSALIDEDGINIPQAVQKFFLPRLRKVMAAEGLPALLSTNSLDKIETSFAGLISKSIDPQEVDDDHLRLDAPEGKEVEESGMGGIAAHELRHLIEFILTDTRTVDNIIKSFPSDLTRDIRSKATETPSIQEAVNLLLEAKKVKSKKSTKADKEKKPLKLPSKSPVKIERGSVTRPFNRFKSKLARLGPNPDVRELRDWIRDVSGSQGGSSAKDLVKLLNYLWD